MIYKEKPTSWKDLQIKVGTILSQCGFNVEVEKKIISPRGTIEIDVYAEESINGRKYSILCECKYWESNIPQTIVHGFRTVIGDIGSNIGYIITTSKYQLGATKTSENTNVELLTWDEFQNLFLNSWFLKYFKETIQRELYFDDDFLWTGWFDDLTKEDRSYYIDIRNKLQEIFEVTDYLLLPTIKNLIHNSFTIPKLPLENNLYDMNDYYGDIPLNILQETSYLEFLDILLVYSKDLITDYYNLQKKYQI